MQTPYTKPFMSITELTHIGLSRDFLKQLSRAEGAPIVRTTKRGKIYFITTELNDFMKEVSARENKKAPRRYK